MEEEGKLMQLTRHGNLWKLKQDKYEFEDSLGYIVSSKIAWTRQGDIVLKTEKRNLELERWLSS